MKTSFIVYILLLFTATTGFPAGERIPAGGRASAMGGSSVALADFWSVCNNQAGAAWLKEGGAGLYFENHFLLKELMFEEVGLVLPLRAGTFGLNLNRFGTDQYNEMKAGLSYAMKFGRNFSAGVQLDYFRIHVGEEYGNKSLVSCEIGLMYHTGKYLDIGVQILNPVPVNITTHPVEQLPAIICIGLSYRFSDSFLSTVEAEKDLLNKPVFRSGADYKVTQQFHILVGMASNPMVFTFGFGIETGRLRIDMASEYHQALGFSPSGSIVYIF